MIDNSTLYEKILVEDGLNNVKHLRDQWNYSSENTLFSGLTDLCSICGADSDQYSYIVRAVKSATLETIYRTIHALMDVYNVKADPIQLSANGNKIANALLCNGCLYIFRRFGIQRRLPDEYIVKLESEMKISDYKYIIPVEGDAFSEIIDHNDDETDPSRGTHSYPLSYFFSEFFPIDEYQKFKKYYKKYVQAVKAYFGIAVVKTLRPNALFSYKRSVREKLRSFDYQKYLAQFCPATALTSQQQAVIEDQFFQQGFSSGLTGKLPFAKCFMTAEWLFDSFEETPGSIDLTPISMGYFKALEQFLYDFIGFHTTEKDGVMREIQFKKNDPPVPFTDATYNGRKNDITMGTMAKFLGTRAQQDMLRPEIDRNTATLIKDMLWKASGLRNGYFHKDNIDVWEKVKKDRELAYLVFYLVLGAYKYDGDAKAHFEFVAPQQKAESQKLFEYIHALSFVTDTLERPLIYLGDDAEKSPWVVPEHDNFIEYDEYGDPTYSGMYYYIIGQQQFTQKYQEDNLPNVICEGRLILGKGDNQPVGIKVTGPEKVIFKDGKFLGNLA